MERSLHHPYSKHEVKCVLVVCRVHDKAQKADTKDKGLGVQT